MHGICQTTGRRSLSSSYCGERFSIKAYEVHSRRLHKRNRKLQCWAFAPDDKRVDSRTNLASSKGEVRGAIVPYRSRFEKHLVRELQMQSPKLVMGSNSARKKWKGAHQPVFLILVSAHLLYTVCQLSGVSIEPSWVPTAVGAFIGTGFTLLCRYGRMRRWQAPAGPLNVVITGSSRGIGKALARQFLMKGDRVLVTSSKSSNVDAAVAELQNEVGLDAPVFGTRCDVSNPASTRKLVWEATQKLGRVDVWINNAGYSGRYQGFVEMSNNQIENVVNTNLLGCLLCTKAAWKLMRGQTSGGHIFNMDGAGADGSATPQYAAYGATKAGIAHMLESLNREITRCGDSVKVHNLSPGMVLTPLLLEGATERNKRVFNILCCQPETAAAYLVPRVRSVAAGKRSGRYIRYLTLLKALRSFLAAPLLANRFFNEKGEAMYQPEKIRLSSPPYIKRFLRQGRALARQDGELAVAYSLSLTASYLLLVAESCKLIPKLPFS